MKSKSASPLRGEQISFFIFGLALVGEHRETGEQC
jgi:hypothetical protein